MDDLHGYVWRPGTDEIRAVVVIFHGYAAHGKYGTIVFAAEVLAGSGKGIAVVAGDSAEIFSDSRVVRSKLIILVETKKI